MVLAGDYNVAPTALDIYPTKSWDKDALIQPKSRAAFKSLVAQGWTDAIRQLHPTRPMFTFWDYKRNRWPRDAGLRLDHLLVSPALAPRLNKAGVDRARARRGRRQRPRAGVDRAEVASGCAGRVAVVSWKVSLLTFSDFCPVSDSRRKRAARGFPVRIGTARLANS